MNLSGVPFVVGYVCIFFCALLGIMWWDRRKQRTRKPFPEDLRLLRMPGEHLWRRVIENDEADLPLWLLVMLIPLPVGAAVLYVVGIFFQSSLVVTAVVTIVVFAFSLLLCARWFQGRLRRRANDYLGFFGERYVAEWLEPLKADGWFIYHDIPCDGATSKFNLDHVAVGPGGIWIVETKTRRKGRARPGFKEHEAFFDGEQVIWPWGEDRSALRQASNNATWLEEWLKKMTGKDYDVSAALTLPGYSVIERKLGAVRVVNPKVLPQVLTGRNKEVLSEEAIDLIRRQLEAKCRNVEY